MMAMSLWISAKSRRSPTTCSSREPDYRWPPWERQRPRRHQLGHLATGRRFQEAGEDAGAPRNG